MLAPVVELSPVEARIVGSLAEKQLTTPQQYPLTLNALVSACNQTSNRDPVVTYDDGTVEAALASLKDAGLLRFVLPSHGRSVTRFRQVLDERFGLDARGLSLLAVLLLRGPQTVGELRTRTERMADFESIHDVSAELARMAEGSDPLVHQMPRRPGQKEERWAQLLAGEMPETVTDVDADPEPGAPVIDTTVVAQSDSLDGAVASLRADIDSLRDELQRISTIVEELRVILD